MYFKHFHNESGYFSLIADMLMGLSQVKTGEGYIDKDKFRVYKQSGQYSYKIYLADERIWMSGSEDDTTQYILLFLDMYRLNEFKTPQKMDMIKSMLELKTRPGDLLRVNGI